jgi:hypothetical protein
MMSDYGWRHLPFSLEASSSMIIYSRFTNYCLQSIMHCQVPIVPFNCILHAARSSHQTLLLRVFKILMCVFKHFTNLSRPALVLPSILVFIFYGQPHSEAIFSITFESTPLIVFNFVMLFIILLLLSNIHSTNSDFFYHMLVYCRKILKNGFICLSQSQNNSKIF